MAMFVHLGLQPYDYPNLDPAAAFVHVAHLSALRAGTLRVISLDGAEGLITFPSYHAALGVIFATSFWTVRSLRWPGLAVNTVMIAATPIDGGHYFIDVLAGIMVAAVSLAAVRALRLHAVKRMFLFQGAGMPAGV
jgi:membrane-associated phospholipid phosphatase